MDSYPALLATLITFAACLFFSALDSGLMRLSHRLGGRPYGIATAKIIAVSSSISAAVMTLEGLLSDGFSTDISKAFFFIATATGLFAIGIGIAYALEFMMSRPDMLEAHAGIRTGIAFGDAMIVIASIIAFAQLAPA